MATLTLFDDQYSRHFPVLGDVSALDMPPTGELKFVQPPKPRPPLLQRHPIPWLVYTAPHRLPALYAAELFFATMKTACLACTSDTELAEVYRRYTAYYDTPTATFEEIRYALSGPIHTPRHIAEHKICLGLVKVFRHTFTGPYALEWRPHAQEPGPYISPFSWHPLPFS